MVGRIVSTLIAALTLGACQHASTASPAVLTDSSPQTMEALKAALATSMDRASVELGAGDPTVSSLVVVLPPRLTDHETRSPATPVRFDLFVDGDRCFAVKEGSEAEIALPGVSCRPA